MASSVAAGIQTVRIGLIPSLAGRLMPELAWLPVEYTEPLFALLRAGLATAILPSLDASQLFDPARSPQVAECIDWLRQRMGEACGHTN